MGAIFTSSNWRNQGLAGSLIESVIDQAQEQKFDGILLFSAIDTDFYTSFDFIGLGGLDFEIYPQNYSALNHSLSDSKKPRSNIRIESRNADILCQTARSALAQGQNSKFHFASFDPWFSETELIEILRCHSRWLARQPYGIARNRHYFSFQLARFLYFATYSTTNKTRWFLTIVKMNKEELLVMLSPNVVAQVCVYWNLSARI